MAIAEAQTIARRPPPIRWEQSHATTTLPDVLQSNLDAGRANKPAFIDARAGTLGVRPAP